MTSLHLLGAALRASGAAMATVAVRRVEAAGRGSLLSLLGDLGVRVLPNTAGCATASEAVLTAKLAREAFDTEARLDSDTRIRHANDRAIRAARLSGWIGPR